MALQGNLSELESRPVGRLLWHYSLPAVVGMLVMALYNVVDRMFIGQGVGPEAIAGLAITFPVMNLTTAVGTLIGVGASAWVSILLGRREYERARCILGNSLVLTVINAVAYIVVFAVFLDPILRVFGASDVTLPYARSYLLWLLPGLLLTNLTFSLNNIIRASGYPRVAMGTMLIGAIGNVVLDPIFIFYLDMGMTGAAIATDIAMVVSAAFVLRHFCRKGVTVGFSRGIYRLRRSIIVQIVSIGAAPALVNACSCLINIFINNTLLRYGGDTAIGAAGIFVTFTSMLTMVVLGICQGMQPIVGYNYGAGNLTRLRRAFWLAMWVSTAICTAGSAVGLLAPQWVARVFTTDDYLIEVTANCLRHAMLGFAIVGIPIVATALFQSLGKSGKSIFMSITRQVLFLLPLMWWLVGVMGVDGVWLSFPASDILATITTAFMVWHQLRALRRERPGGGA